MQLISLVGESALEVGIQGCRQGGDFTASHASLKLACCAGKPKLPDGFEAETWAKLQDAVHAVHAKRPVSCSLEELYRVRPRVLYW